MRLHRAAVLLLAGCASGRDPVISLRGPTVVALYAIPPDSVLESDWQVASVLDQQMYFWSESRPRLDSLGMAPTEEGLEWTARRATLRMAGGCWRVQLPPEPLGTVGYLLAAPGREPRLIARFMMDEELADSAAAFLRTPPAATLPRC